MCRDSSDRFLRSMYACSCVCILDDLKMRSHQYMSILPMQYLMVFAA